MRIFILLLLFFQISIAETQDERALNALERFKSARDATSLSSAAEILSSHLRVDHPLMPETWAAVQKNIPKLLPKLDPYVRIRLVSTITHWSPESVQADALRFREEAIDAALSIAEKKKDNQTLNLLNGVGGLFRKKIDTPKWMVKNPDSHVVWRTKMWAEEYRALYLPRAKRFEALARSWNPARDPEFGSGLEKCAQDHPACQEFIRILLERIAKSPTAEQPLQSGLMLLRSCLKAYDEGAEVITKAAEFFEQNLNLNAENIRLWRGHPRVGSALFKLFFGPADGNFVRGELRRSPDDENSLLRIALPPSNERKTVIAKCLTGLENGFKAMDHDSFVTFQLVFHIMSFPDGYEGLLTPDIEQRIFKLFAGEDDYVRLFAFNILGHLAGRDGIEAVYTKALPVLKDVLLPEEPKSLVLRGEAMKIFQGGLGELLISSRLRLSLCNIPLAEEDHNRVFKWYSVRSDLMIPAAAWLVRNAQPGQNPLAKRNNSLLESYWPDLVASSTNKEPKAPQNWRSNLYSACSYLGEFPEWEEGPAVIDAYLDDPKQFPALVHFLSYVNKNRERLTKSIGGHQRLKETVFKAINTLPPDRNTQLKDFELAIVLGDICNEKKLAADTMAKLFRPRPNINYEVMYIARWVPDHPALDELSATWDDDAASWLANPFRRWFLAVLRGREPGEFPRLSYLCHLQSKIGDDVRRIIEYDATMFKKYRDQFRELCAPQLNNYLDLTMIQAKFIP